MIAQLLQTFVTKKHDKSTGVYIWGHRTVPQFVARKWGFKMRLWSQNGLQSLVW